MFNIVRFCFFLVSFSLISCYQKKEETQANKAPKEIQVIDSSFKLPPVPNEMIFCGEIIDLTDIDIRERLDRELLVNIYYHSATTLYIKRANRFFPLIESILKQEHLPSDIKYLAVAESGLSQAVSPAGAKGFWQFMPVTAKEYGLIVNEKVDERYHLEKSTRAACTYLKASKSKLNEWFNTIASYNRGVGGVNSDMSWQGTDDYFDTYMNNETGRYVFRMMALKLIMENPDKYGFNTQTIELYQPYETIEVKVEEGISDIAAWAAKRSMNYKIIKLLNPWILSNSLPKNEVFILELPSESMKLNPRSKNK